MSEYMNKQGTWMVYDYDTGPYAIILFPDVVPAAKYSAQHGFGRVGFWPHGTSLVEGIDWWEDKTAEVISSQLDLSQSIVHFFYDDGITGESPICQVENKDEWVRFDHSAIGKICPQCQDLIGRKIQ